jgi:hypothetical protein
MSLEVERVKAENHINSDFLEWLIFQQIMFECGLIATDGSLYDHNTLEHGLTRGVGGETTEALEKLQEIREIEVLTPDQEELLKKLYKEFYEEVADIFIFFASVLLHMNIHPAEFMRIVIAKMEKNHEKYRKENFQGKTIAEGLQYSRDKWDRHTPEQRYEERRLNGHPMPRTGDLFGATPEPEYSTAGAGAIT